MMNLNRRAVWARPPRAARVWPYTCTCRPHVYVHVYVYVLPFRAHRMTMRHEGLIMSGAMSAPGWRGASVCRVTPHTATVTGRRARGVINVSDRAACGRRNRCVRARALVSRYSKCDFGHMTAQLQ